MNNRKYSAERNLTTSKYIEGRQKFGIKKNFWQMSKSSPIFLSAMVNNFWEPCLRYKQMGLKTI